MGNSRPRDCIWLSTIKQSSILHGSLSMPLTLLITKAQSAIKRHQDFLKTIIKAYNICSQSWATGEKMCTTWHITCTKKSSWEKKGIWKGPGQEWTVQSWHFVMIGTHGDLFEELCTLYSQGHLCHPQLLALFIKCHYSQENLVAKFQRLLKMPYREKLHLCPLFHSSGSKVPSSNYM